MEKLMLEVAEHISSKTNIIFSDDINTNHIYFDVAPDDITRPHLIFIENVAIGQTINYNGTMSAMKVCELSIYALSKNKKQAKDWIDEITVAIDEQTYSDNKKITSLRYRSPEYLGRYDNGFYEYQISLEMNYQK